MLYQQAFGRSFMLGIKLPASFQDQSYKNDACPCFIHRLSDGRAIMLWVDFEAPDRREFPDNKRYTLELYIQDYCCYKIIETDVPEIISDRLAVL